MGLELDEERNAAQTDGHEGLISRDGSRLAAYVIPTDEELYESNCPRWVAIRYGKYKYIRTLLAGEMEEIYDVEADPQELTNLALRPENRVLLADLRAKTVAELRRTKAPFVESMPASRQMGTKN